MIEFYTVGLNLKSDPLFCFVRPQKVVDSAKEIGVNLKKVADDVVAKVSEKPAAPATA